MQQNSSGQGILFEAVRYSMMGEIEGGKGVLGSPWGDYTNYVLAKPQRTFLNVKLVR